MKKLIAILLCLVLVFSLAACSGDNSDKSLKDEIADSENNDDVNVDTDEAEVKISRGVISGDEYENGFAGFTFTKPASWNYLTDEEISTTVNAGQEMLDTDELEEELLEKASYYDMAANDASGNSVMVCYENTEISGGREYTAKEYLDSIKQGLKSVAELDYTVGDIEDVKLGNETYKKLSATLSAQGVEVTQAYYAKAAGKYIVGVVVTCVDQDLSDIEDMFS